MSQKKYPEEFKMEAARQVVEKVIRWPRRQPVWA